MSFSIKGKLYIFLLSLIGILFTTTLVFAYFGFEEFYMWQRKETLAKTGLQIESLYLEKQTDSFKKIDAISSDLGITITVIDTNKKIAYTSKPRRDIVDEAGLKKTDLYDNMNDSMIWHDYLSNESKQEWFDNKTSFTRIISQDNISSELIMIRHIQEQKFLVLHQSLAPIQENVNIALTFITTSSLITLILGFTFVFFYTKRFTKPLTELTSLAKDMSNLNFNQRWKVAGNDELNILGHTLNQLAEELNSTLQQLNSTNIRLEKELSKAHTLDQMRKNFVSSVSHELKTPLALIQGYAEGLSLPSIAKDPQSRDHYTSIIIDETVKMDKLVKDLLNLSQMKSGVFTLQESRFNLKGVIQDVINSFSKAIKEKNISLNTNLPDMPDAFGDKLRLNQVITNLLSNAIDHTDMNKRIEITGEEEDTCYRVTIYNEGITIPDDETELLWTSFYKRDKARMRTFGGSGLGLSIVKALQQLHGQQFGLYNKPDGVAFWITVKKQKTVQYL